MTDLPASARPGPTPPTPSPAAGAPRWLGPTMLAVALVVLGSTISYAVRLADAGVTWTDGPAAYGAQVDDIAWPLPPALVHAVEVVMLVAFLFGPVLMAPIVFGAALRLRSSRRRGWSDDRAAIAIAVATLVSAVALVVLVAAWGDELWVWALD